MVGLVDYTQQIGHSSGPGVVAEVEASHAARSVLRSNDYDHGAYSVGFGGATVFSGTPAVTTNQMLAGFRWISTKNFLLVKKINGFVTQLTTSSGSAGIVRLTATKAVSFTQQFDTYAPTSGTSFPAIPITGVSFATLGAGNKYRSTMLNSDASSGGQVSAAGTGTAVMGPSLVYASATASGGTYFPVLTGGVYSLDAVPLGQIVSSATALSPANRGSMPWQTLFDADIGPPLALENYSGLVFSFDAPGGSVGAAGGFSYAVNIMWDEVAAYPLGTNT